MNCAGLAHIPIFAKQHIHDDVPALANDAEAEVLTPAGVLACRPGRGFRGPSRQSEISQAAVHYL